MPERVSTAWCGRPTRTIRAASCRKRPSLLIRLHSVAGQIFCLGGFGEFETFLHGLFEARVAGRDFYTGTEEIRPMEIVIRDFVVHAEAAGVAHGPGEAAIRVIGHGGQIRRQLAYVLWSHTFVVEVDPGRTFHLLSKIRRGPIGGIFYIVA